MSIQNVFQKQFNLKLSLGLKSEKPNFFVFNALSAFAAMLFFVSASGFKLSFNTEFLWYSFFFAVSYSTAITGLIFSIYYGSLSLTALITSYSLVIPTLFGIVFLKEEIGIYIYIGIFLLMVSLFLVNAKNEKIVVSPKWFLWITVAFIGNGMTSVVQKLQQTAMSGMYKYEFMIVALGITTVIMYLISLTDFKSIKGTFKSAKILASLNGIANGATNLQVIFLTGILPASVLFPSISAGGIIITFLLSQFVYCEHLSKTQLIGVTFGTLSVILMNI